MTNKLLATVTALLMTILTSAPARADHADEETSYDGLVAGAAIVLAVEATPLVLGAVDLLARPSSRTYGAVEIAAGGLAAGVNTFAAIDFATTSNCSTCADPVPYLIGLAVIDAAVAAHGIYLVTRDRPAADSTVSIGNVRGRVAPTLVSDGAQQGAGLGVVGRF